MSKQDIKQLRDRDPQKRKIAIKRLARDVDRSALRQLAIMAGDDPEPELRKLARNAGVYIRQQLGEIPVDDDDKGKKDKSDTSSKKFIVSQRNITAAQNEVNAAMTYQIAEDEEKTVKSLQKALALNPNLRHDDYFVSLCESIMGKSGQEAVEALTAESKDKTRRGGLLGLFGK